MSKKMNWGKVAAQNRAQKYGLEIDFNVGADPNKIPPHVNPQRSHQNDKMIILPGTFSPKSQKASSQKVIISKPKSKQVTVTKKVASDTVHKLVSCQICNKMFSRYYLAIHIHDNHIKQNDTTQNQEDNIISNKIKYSSTATHNNKLVKCCQCNAMVIESRLNKHMRKVHKSNDTAHIETNETTSKKLILQPASVANAIRNKSQQTKKKKVNRPEMPTRKVLLSQIMSKKPEDYVRCEHCNLMIIKDRIKSHCKRVHSKPPI